MEKEPGQPEERPSAGNSERRSGVVTLLFTDVVGSTALKEQLGDRAGVELIEQHHALVRRTLAEFKGAEEIVVAGDSFLVLFPVPSEAVRCALLVQSRLAKFNQRQAVPVLDRVGLHMGEVLIQELDRNQRNVHGMQVDTCARVMGLAQAGQILLTRPVFDNARQSLKGEEIEGVLGLEWLNHGRFELKGVAEPVEVCEVRPAGTSKLSPPTTSDKARRVEAAEGEAVLGWRPAVGLAVPNSHWILEEKLGEGGFGEVWLGQHQMMKERRVFKFCFRADRVRSLKREMTLFRLIKERIGDHPNIVSLREVYFDQPPYYVEEEYVPGQDLATWCEARGGPDKIPLETRLEIVAQIADGLQAAHDAGVIHRDVKPANILVSSAKFDHRGKSDPNASPIEPSSLLVKLTDFGIGQVVSEEYLSGVTRAGFTQTLLSSSSTSQTGTHLYMAPELLVGNPASTRSDIYSLGVVLYQLLIGNLKRPLTTDWTEEIADPLLKEDLHQCLAGNPANRFAGAALLARNLRSLPRRQAQRAAQQQAQRHAERRRFITRVSLAGALGLLLLAGALGYGLHRAKLEALNARRVAYASDMNLAWQALKTKNLGEVRALLEAQLPAPGRPDLRNWEWRYLWSASRGEQLWTVGPMPGPVRGLRWLPDGHLVASSSDPAALTVWDTDKRELVRTSGGRVRNCSGMAVSPDGRFIASANWNYNTVQLRSAESLQVVAELPHQTVIIRVAFSPDSRLLSCRGTEELAVWEIASRTKLWTTKAVSDSHCDAPFSSDGRAIFSQASGNFLGVFNATNGTLLSQLGPHAAFASEIALSSDGKLAAADWQGQLFLIDVAQPGTRVLTNQTGAIYAVAFAPDGRTLAAGSTDAVITIWDVESGTPIREFRGHGKEVSSLLFSSDGQTLFSGALDGTIRAWNPHQTGQPETNVIPADAIAGAMTRNGRFVPLYRLATQTGSVLDLEKKTESPRGTITTNFWQGVTTFTVSQRGREVAFAMRSGSVVVWADGKLFPSVQAHSNAVVAVEFSADSSHLAAASQDGEVRVWDWPGFQPVFTRQVPDPPREMVFSRDGSFLAVAAGDICILPLRGGSNRHIFCGGFVPSVALSSDSALVAGGLNSEVRVWDVKSLRLVRRFEGGRGDFTCVGFSRDGQRVLACDFSGVTWLWDLTTGRNVARFRPPGRFASARFQENGNTIVLQSGGLGMDSVSLEMLRAPSWAEIEKIEKSDAQACPVWDRK